MEALSRGAAKVVFVEKSKILAHLIKRNLTFLHQEGLLKRYLIRHVRKQRYKKTYLYMT